MSEKQCAIRVRENRQIDRKKIPVTMNKYIVSEKEKMTWHRVRELSYQVIGLEGLLRPKPHIFIDDRFSLPISPYKNVISKEKIKKLTDKTEVFRDSFNGTKDLSEQERRRAERGDILTYALLIAVFLFSLVIVGTTKFDFKSILGF